MRRLKGSGKLGAGGAHIAEEDINPLDGLANLSDVMLVFACGLILSLIAYWNVDVAGIGGASVAQGVEVSDMQGLDGDGNPLDGDNALEEYGTVFRDADGKLYMVTKD